jgi:hypothetical protein
LPRTVRCRRRPAARGRSPAMKRLHAGDGLIQLVARVLFCALLATGALGQAGPEGAANAAEEEFADVDPYTKGKPELVKQAGYVTLQPFTFAEGIQAQDMVEILGGVELLWAETAHFKICSSLKTYRSKADQQENDAIDRDIAQLARKVSTFKNQRGGHARPVAATALVCVEAGAPLCGVLPAHGILGRGLPSRRDEARNGIRPWLGQKLKPTVLLSEKSSTLGRFTRQYVKREESYSQRYLLPGGSMFFGISPPRPCARTALNSTARCTARSPPASCPISSTDCATTPGRHRCGSTSAWGTGFVDASTNASPSTPTERHVAKATSTYGNRACARWSTTSSSTPGPTCSPRRNGRSSRPRRTS